ncbi:hypothetical protein [Anaerosalibacter sp. Marseille-P3206]|uniref:hypothetical protein n=1 Tax=Anaerosalibacter sp. Marseille-P3206 TaxID=1871005 RepID=UPI000984B7DA|nr:hypothetical protein [Anaerosalibacter sp. Marseille-P3206]
MKETLLVDIASTVAELKDEVLLIEAEMNNYHQDMNKKIKTIYNKINDNENDILDDKVWINEYLVFNDLQKR